MSRGRRDVTLPIGTEGGHTWCGEASTLGTEIGTEVSHVGHGGITCGTWRCHLWAQRCHPAGHGTEVSPVAPNPHVGTWRCPRGRCGPPMEERVTRGAQVCHPWAQCSPTVGTGEHPEHGGGVGGNWAHWEALRGSSAGGCGWWGGDHGVIVGMWHWEHWECGRQNGVALRALSGTGMQQGGTGSTG